MARTVPVRELRSNLAELLSDVADRRDHVVVTRNGRPAAALVPIDEYEALEETAEVLSDPDVLCSLEGGLLNSTQTRQSRWTKCGASSPSGDPRDERCRA